MTKRALKGPGEKGGLKNVKLFLKNRAEFMVNMWETHSENLSKPLIAEAIEKRQQDRAERTQTNADWVINELVSNHLPLPKTAIWHNQRGR